MANVPEHRTAIRVIYADTDMMGVAYYGNYLRWFEIGRTEMIRSWGMAYKELERRGVFLPVSEVRCKYISSARYDDVLSVETSLDPGVRAGMKFDYRVFEQKEERLLAEGHTVHVFTDRAGKVVRPPKFLRELLRERIEKAPPNGEIGPA